MVSAPWCWASRLPLVARCSWSPSSPSSTAMPTAPSSGRAERCCYSLGFVIATGLLHGVGISIGLDPALGLRSQILRGAGALVMAGGSTSCGVRRHEATRGLSPGWRRGSRPCPRCAQAHLVNSGLGPFYDGALHLLLSPGDLLGLIALALLAGLRGPAAARAAVIVLPIVWLLAGLVGLSLAAMPDLAWLSISLSCSWACWWRSISDCRRSSSPRWLGSSGRCTAC